MISEGGYLTNRRRHRPFFEEVCDEWVVVLPHQCDSWHIGDADDISALVADLQAMVSMPVPDGARYEHTPTWPDETD